MPLSQRTDLVRAFHAGVWLLLMASSGQAADAPVGETIYQRHCVRCHGINGGGSTEHYPKALTGDRGIDELGQYIGKEMPPDQPGLLKANEAEQVARYIHGAFYSAEAQLRLHPPRIETTRLTGRQYAQTIADLMVAFYGPPARSNDRGLKGNYTTVNKNGDGKQVFERLDPQISFDFKDGSPKQGEFDPAEFAISWNGSIRAPLTGDYEFTVRSPNSFKLHVNDRKTALIDAWIQSGDQTEFRGTVRLLAGRDYPVQLFFTKAGQGVKKPEELRKKIAPASITLSWKPPGRNQEIIPTSNLSPAEPRETLVVRTPFPPDDRSTGIERGTSVSTEWDQAATDAAIEAVDFVISHIGDLSGFAEIEKKHEGTLKEFCGRFAERAFRRPLTKEQRALYIDRPFASAPDVASAVERVVLLVLKSPRFLYTQLPGTGVDSYGVAERLSFTLWDSLPDDTLLNAAATGKLKTRAQIAEQARRMCNDPRFENKMREFFVQWLKVDHAPALRKDPLEFPDFSGAVAADLKTSLDLFLEDLLHEPAMDFRRFLTADFLYLNAKLAPLYGAQGVAGDSFQKVTIKSEDRAGLLTHPYIMAVFADTRSTSPIRRGVFLARSVLGRTLNPPPDAVTPVPPDLHPKLTTRERTVLQTGAKSCQSCHGLINPLGFTLERYDALGRLHATENGKPIDANGSYQSRGGQSVALNGAKELSRFLVDSDEVQTALIEKLFYFSTMQPIRAHGPDALPNLKRDFLAGDRDLRRLMASMATLAASTPPSVSQSTPPKASASTQGRKP